MKGREQFTPRFLRYTPPCRLIIADGSDLPQLDECVGEYNYFYAGPDTTVSRWWHKMVMAFDRVETPYVMVADNDDFVTQHVSRSVDFLDRHHDYVAHSGRLQGFWMWPDKVHGPHYRLSKRYAPFDVPADYCGNDANLRVLAGFQNSWSYYAVYRTQALKTIWTEVRDLDLSNLQIHEKFCAMRALSLGKIKCDPDYTSYLRQYGTTMVAGHNTDFSLNLFSTDFSGDIKRVLDRMELHGVNRAALAHLWAKWFDGYLYRNYGPWAQARKWASKRWPRARVRYEPILRTCGIIR